jgi:hypothetical protein
VSLIDKKKLAFVLPSMKGGGAERVALRLISDVVDRGFNVDLLLMSVEGELLELVPPSVNVIDLHAGRIRQALGPIIAYLRRSKPVGVQISMWPLTVIGALAHRIARSNARLVLSDHNTLSKQYAHFGAGRRAMMRISSRLTYPLADTRIAVSQGVADDLAQLTGLPRDSLRPRSSGGRGHLGQCIDPYPQRRQPHGPKGSSPADCGVPDAA